jgi:hypothetical protein
VLGRSPHHQAMQTCPTPWVAPPPGRRGGRSSGPARGSGPGSGAAPRRPVGQTRSRRGRRCGAHRIGGHPAAVMAACPQMQTSLAHSTVVMVSQARRPSGCWQQASSWCATLMDTGSDPRPRSGRSLAAPPAAPAGGGSRGAGGLAAAQGGCGRLGCAVWFASAPLQGCRLGREGGRHRGDDRGVVPPVPAARPGAGIDPS